MSKKCPAHPSIEDDLEKIKNVLKEVEHWKGIAQEKQKQTESYIIETRSAIKSIKKDIQNILIKLNKDFSTWDAHENLRKNTRQDVNEINSDVKEIENTFNQKIQEVEKENKRFVVKVISLSISAAGVLFGAIQALIMLLT